MPKAAMFFSIILLSTMMSTSYAFISSDLVSIDTPNPIIFDSEIIEIDSNFFTENNFKRYLFFGTNPSTY